MSYTLLIFNFRKLSNGSYEVERLIPIPRDYLSTSIEYSYFVVSGNSTMMEYIYNTTDNIRYLYVKPDDLKNTDGNFTIHVIIDNGKDILCGF